MKIRKALETDLNDVLEVERLAFGYDKEAELVRALLQDPSAEPLLSLLAFNDHRAVGHILFTAAQLSEAGDKASIRLLAPLAIVPDAQKQGIGGKLIKQGLEMLGRAGVELVFVWAIQNTTLVWDSHLPGVSDLRRPIPYRMNMPAPGWFRRSGRG